MLRTRISGISRCRAPLRLYAGILVSLLLACYYFLHPKALTPVDPPPYTPFASRKCTPGQPCARTELEALNLDKQGNLRSFGFPNQTLSCSPSAYSNGSWAFRPPSPPGTVPDRMRDPLDAMKFAGFEGCASSRLVEWALGADVKEQWGRWPNVTRWEWVPREGCAGLEQWEKERMVRHLVEEGGWLLIGDSVTGNHFFSLSCLLYPHVIATPNYHNPIVRLTTDRGSFQHLYLNPASPLASPLHPNPPSFPPGFSILKTPLVTFRRVDVLYSKAELVAMHEEWYPGYPSRTHLFNNKERLHTQSVEEALSYLTAPPPYGNYATMVVNTGGHWRTTLFRGYADSEKEGGGIDGIVAFYERVARRWLWEVQERLSSEMRDENEREGESTVVIGASSSRRKKNVIIRPYLPGHDHCREAKGVLKEVEVMEYERYNWRHIWKFNHIFETLLTDRQTYPNIHYLPIDRPGRLRPDGHTAKDCLHVMAGAGVLEGWTRYIWHFVTQELGARA